MQFDEALHLTSDSAGIGISWNGTPLTRGAELCAQASSNFPFASVWYLVNPTPATGGSLTFTSSNLSAFYGAFTISGVATGTNPLTAAVYGYTTQATSASFNVPTNGSFAVVAESARVTGTNPPWALTARSPAPASTNNGVVTIHR